MMLTLVIGVLPICLHNELFALLETKQLIHLIHAQSFGVVDEKEGVDTSANKRGGEEDVYAPFHRGVHLRQGLEQS